MSEHVKNALRVLLSEAIDYAGLFPPAQLSMAAAVENYANYLHGDYSWMLGRFIVPADLLDDFSQEAKDFWATKNSKIWRVSVLARENLEDAVQRVEIFNALNEGNAVIDTLEARADDAATIKRAKEILPVRLATYFEIPLAPQLPEQISALAVSRTRAKFARAALCRKRFPRLTS